MILRVKDKDYNLRLNTRGCVNCEKRLGKNPLNVFMEAQDNKMPKITDLMVILHECLIPLNHKVSLDDVYDIYDEFCEGGGDIMQLIEVLVGVFEEAGFIPKEDSKN